MENVETPTLSLTQDERIMAALSHAAILLPMTGAVVPIVIWITQKEKSKFVAFQSLQAVVYHLFLILAWFLGFACYMVSIFGTMAVIPFAEPSNADTVAFLFTLFPFGALGLMFCGGGILLLYGLVGAVMTFMGKDFRYLLIGSFLERRWQS